MQSVSYTHDSFVEDAGKLIVQKHRRRSSRELDEEVSYACCFPLTQESYEVEEKYLHQLTHKLKMRMDEVEGLTARLDELCASERPDYPRIVVLNDAVLVVGQAFINVCALKERVERRLVVSCLCRCADVQAALMALVVLAITGLCVATSSMALAWSAMFLYIWNLVAVAGMITYFGIALCKRKVPVGVSGSWVFGGHLICATLFTLPTLWFHSSLSYLASSIWTVTGLLAVWRGFIRPHECGPTPATRGKLEHVLYVPGCLGLIVGVCFPPGFVQMALVAGGIGTVWLLVANLVCSSVVTVPVSFRILFGYASASISVATLVACTYDSGAIVWVGLVVSVCGMIMSAWISAYLSKRNVPETQILVV